MKKARIILLTLLLSITSQIDFAQDSCYVYIPSVLNESCDARIPGYTLQVLTNCEYYFYNLTIYNKYGEKIFESKNITETWNARNFSDGIYIYFIKAETTTGQKINYRGTVTVLK